MGRPSDIDLSLANIWKSWYNFRKGKRNSLVILEFEWHLEDQLINLHLDLNQQSYRHGQYDHFIVNDTKRRDIAVANVRDRVVHRLLYDYLVQVCDSRFDHDVWSCRVGKGNTAALQRVTQLLKKYPRGYVWRADVQKFFDNVDQAVLIKLLRGYDLGKEATLLLDDVICSYSITGQTGIPIGNLTSQILANVYLHEFDHYVRHSLKPLGYTRYGDDFILIGKTKEDAIDFQSLGSDFLASRLRLSLHAQNNVIMPVRGGLRYLGVTTFLLGTTLSKKTYNNINDKLAGKNYDSYLSYVNHYASDKQKAIMNSNRLDPLGNSLI